MTRKHLLILAAIAVLLAIVAAAISQWSKPREVSVVGGRLYPQLEARLNEVARIEARTAGQDPVTLVLKDRAWRVTDRWNYPADSSKIRQDLLGLARLELIEAKTQDPANYAVLGVQDIDDAQADTQWLKLSTADGEVLADVLIGKVGLGSGSYVRRVDEEQAWLTSNLVRSPKTIAEWLERDLFDVVEERVHRIAVAPVSGQPFTAEKPARDAKEFTLTPVPPGRNLNVSELMRTVRVFKGLRLDDVMPDAEADKDATPWNRLLMQSFEGLVIDGQARQVKEQYQFRFKASYDAALAQRFALPAAAESEPQDKATPAAQREAERINQRYQGWTFVLAPYRGEPAIPTLDQITTLPEAE